MDPVHFISVHTTLLTSRFIVTLLWKVIPVCVARDGEQKSYEYFQAFRAHSFGNHCRCRTHKVNRDVVISALLVLISVHTQLLSWAFPMQNFESIVQNKMFEYSSQKEYKALPNSQPEQSETLLADTEKAKPDEKQRKSNFPRCCIVLLWLVSFCITALFSAFLGRQWFVNPDVVCAAHTSRYCIDSPKVCELLEQTV